MLLQKELKPFKKKKSQIINDFQASLEQRDHLIIIEYRLKYQSPPILWYKNSANIERKIGLWEGTCFELFWRNPLNGHYLEFNFSGTGFWNCFIFYEKNGPLKEYFILTPELHQLIKLPSSLSFSIGFNLQHFPSDFLQGPKNLKGIEVGITSVIKYNENDFDFFAINHSEKEMPDFHDPNTFVEI